jgi:hypothetical protein
MQVTHLAGDADVAQFLDDPGKYFNRSYTAMQSVPLDELEALQLAAVRTRFEQHVKSIPMLAKLAERQGVDRVGTLGDVLPVLFEHTMYKSYPQILLERRDFVSLTRWFDKLTSHDLSGLDASGCESIDGWLAWLYETAGLDPMFSSGTTGTMSFIPWSSRDLEVSAASRRPVLLQPFGSDPLYLADVPVHYASMVNRNRRDYLGPAIGLGRDGFGHVFEPEGQSADMLWLSSQLRLAAARGDASRVNVPPSLMARKDEFARREATAEERRRKWIDSLLALRGELIVWSAHPYAIVEIAAERLAAGQRCEFAPGAQMNMTGGTKGRVMPDDWYETVRAFANMPLGWIYGMAEISTTFKLCDNERYHVSPWIVPYLLDPDTSQLLPRRGVQTGRFAFLDLLPTSHWGGFITGDELEIDFDAACPCGASTTHAAKSVQRLSEKRGGDDKINCAASPAAHAEAMAYLVGL